MSKLILVILDGLEYNTAKLCMGFLQGLCEDKRGKLYKLTSELPSSSRALYECILTGVKPVKSGVVNNISNFSSKQKSIFYYAKKAKLKAGAAAYYWVSELYNRTPFDMVHDRHVEDGSLSIPYGHFYWEDDYPDNHLFSDGENLRRKYNLDFTLFHSMNIDNAGHLYSLKSKEYRNATRKADVILSTLLLSWLDEDINVIVTADHGMNADFSHGGILKEEREVPFFTFGNAFSLKDTKIKQTDICGISCEILGIYHDKPFCKEILK